MKYSLSQLLEIEEKPRKLKKPPYQLYCDMDGVLCDFSGRFEHFTGMSPSEYKETKGTKLFWNLIDGVGEVFWSGMNWTPRGRELWGFIEPYRPQLLSAPSLDESSRQGKALWIQKNLPSWVQVHFRPAQRKQEFANPKAILIDDKESTIQEWRANGGLAIYHPENATSITPILKKLKELGYDR